MQGTPLVTPYGSRGTGLRRLQLPHSALDTALIAASGVGAFLLRFEFELPAIEKPHLLVALPIWVFTKLVIFHWYRFDRRAWHLPSVNDVLQLAGAIILASSLCSAFLMLFPAGFPRSVLILDLMLSFLCFSARFLGGRFVLETKPVAANSEARDVFIYGASRAGVALLSELRRNPGLGYRVRGFIDDNPRLSGMYVQGAKVLGSGRDIGALSVGLNVKEVLIAAPSAGGEPMLRILKNCQRAQTNYRTVPALGEIVESAAITPQIREVDVQDLLPRQPASLDHQLLLERIAGKVVMVTGAAGSIGSELCRQIAGYKPAAILAFEVAETPLFHLGREMQAKYPDVRFCGEIGSVQNDRRVRSLLAQYRPSAIYHAAAYKHVPIMESSVVEAVSNNVLGTHAVAWAARDCGVSEFVLISSDKAVRPTSVMGATKRLCEQLILGMPAGDTRYLAVRFGNVLGSSGSVVPLFKQQIANGGPITITHPEMRRYFMTIPEAAQLVLQAVSMGQGGEIFVLDMGEQVRIVDIARKLILLSGLTPEVDIKIEFTGVRPGEKLYEELSLADEATVATRHRKIKIYTGPGRSTFGIGNPIERLRKLCDEGRSPELIRLIRNLVPEYQPSEMVLSMAGDRGPAISLGPNSERPPRSRAAAVGT
jgi:FlaA1/EpsC-like NDP-sugar epimerase